MKLELVNRLLEVEMTISYKGKTKIIDKLVIDTGAAHSSYFIRYFLSF